MAKASRPQPETTPRKEVVWLHGEIKSPPFSVEARQEAGMLLRLLQEGEKFGMPHAEPLPIVGPRCGAIRVPDGEHNWRVMYRVDADMVIVAEVYDKKTRTIPDRIIKVCQKRLAEYDATKKKHATDTKKKPKRE